LLAAEQGATLLVVEAVLAGIALPQVLLVVALLRKEQLT
jgi:hypothetical protein